MLTVHIRFYQELNFFLPEEKRKTWIEAGIIPGMTTKALIEELGVPHTEVDLILVNGESVDFSHQITTGDRISVYPVFESLDLTGYSRVRPVPLRDTRFVLDVHLGKLSVFLRLCGFDTRYSNRWTDEVLMGISTGEKRILLTRDRELLKRKALTHAYYVRSRDPREQLEEVFRRFDLWKGVKPFSRCLRCNEQLEPAARESVLPRLPPIVRARYSKFSLCPVCKRVYWRGTHWEHMKNWIDSFLGGKV